MTDEQSKAPGKTTELAMRLALERTRGEAIDDLIDAYEELGSLDKVAFKFDVGKRTLERWIARTPELSRRIDETRERKKAPK